MSADHQPATIRADARLRLGFGAYVGVMLAATAVIAIAISGRPPAVLTGGGLAAGGIGLVTGFFFAARIPGLAARLASTRRRRVAPFFPTIPFAAAGGVAALRPLGERVGSVALVSIAAVTVCAIVLTALAENRYVDAVTPDDPTATTGWTPPASSRLHLVAAAGFVLLGLGSAAEGNVTFATLWLLLGVSYAVTTVVEGRAGSGPWETACELRVHQAGLVKKRPYAKTLVPWPAVRRARLRGGELVLERDLLDVRFDRDDLDDPEAIHRQITRALAGDGTRRAAGD